MRKALGILCVLAVFIAVLSGCAGCNGVEKEEQPLVKDGIIINTVHIMEQPLSEVKTYEDDWFAINYNVKQPYIDDNGAMYYYEVSEDSDSALYFLHYDNGVNKSINIGLPEMDYFTVGAILDDIIYGVEHNDGDANDRFISKFQNSAVKRLFESPIEGCYFAKEGIYYQSGNKINLMDYNGQNSKLIVEIPVELYVDSIHSKFIVYRGKLWYSYDDFFKEYYYPLWCYDFDKTFTRFDKGGLDAVNNGFLYYTAKGSNNHDVLYRLNCETYCVEPVIDASIIGSYSFADNYILYSSWDSVTNAENLYRLDEKVNEKILSPNQLGQSDSFLDVSYSNNRIFITGDSGFFYTCLAEIDTNGNIKKIIHGD